MRRKVKCFAAIVCSAFLLMSLLVTSAFAARPPATPASQLKKPGENGYVSLHKYATPTDVEDVYKITLTVQGIYEQPPILVTLVLDHSGSMTGSGVTGAATRHEAVAAGAQAAVAALEASGNPNIWVNVVSYSAGATIDAAAQSLTTEFNTSGTGWSGTNAAFQPLFIGGVSNPIIAGSINRYTGATFGTRPSGQTGNTWIGAGEKQAHDDLMAAKTAIGGGSLGGVPVPSGVDYDGFVNYVMILTDGDDNGYGYATDTQTWALALKTPTSKKIEVSVATSQTATTRQATPVDGAGATVWSVVVAGTEPANWQSEWVQFANGVAGTTLGSLGATYPSMPQAMIGVAAPINWASVTTPWLALTNISFSAGAVGTTNYANLLKEIAGNLKLNGGALDGTEFSAHNTINGVTDTFTAFANAAVSNAGGVEVHDRIGSQFSLYQYPGEPLFKTEATGVTTTGLAAVPGTAGSAGRDITWNIGDLESGITYTLTYYVKINSATADPNLWYPTNEYAYISYSLGPDDFIVYFPEPLVNVVGEIDSQEPEPAPEPEPEAAASYNALPNLPMYVGAFGTPLQPYTPSVTPPTVKVEEEYLDDGTVEGYDGVVPWTGQITYAVLLIVVVCLVGGIVLLWRKRLLRR